MLKTKRPSFFLQPNSLIPNPSRNRQKVSYKTDQTQKVTAFFSPLDPLLHSSGKLKVKMFSKMKEKNTIDSPKGLHTKNDPDSSYGDGSFANPAAIGKHNLPSMMPSPVASKIKKPKTATRSVLRPNDMTPGMNCSIHCDGATGPPVLSCFNCHRLFHPVCVGLMEGPDYSSFDFYCADCRPPPGKECVEMPPPLTKKADNRKSGFMSHIPSMAQRISSSPPVSQGFQNSALATTSQKSKKMQSKKSPLRPIESQAVINVAGTKYLVVPHPTVSNEPKKVKKTPDLLPLLLKPANPITKSGDRLPSFEIEQSADGKMILIPFDDKSNAKLLPMKQFDASTKEATRSFNSNDLSSHYYALLHVFRYLTPSELIIAGKVCKVWRQVSLNPSLWHNLRLKNCKVTDWSSLARHLVRTQTSGLDFRKMIHANPDHPDETWSNVCKISPSFQSLKRIELPKVQAKTLNDIVANIVSSPISNLNQICAGSVATSKEENNSVDLEIYSSVSQLQELKLKASSGHLRVIHLDSGLDALLSNSRFSLKKLSLTSVEGLTNKHLDVLSQLANLEVLELGDCGLLNNTLFSKLITMKRLVHLRLEKGLIGHEVGTLDHFEKLRNLELVDVELKPGFGEGFVKLRKLSKLLLIPCYRDEVSVV